MSKSSVEKEANKIVRKVRKEVEQAQDRLSGFSTEKLIEMLKENYEKIQQLKKENLKDEHK